MISCIKSHEDWFKDGILVLLLVVVAAPGGLGMAEDVVDGPESVNPAKLLMFCFCIMTDWYMETNLLKFERWINCFKSESSGQLDDESRDTADSNSVTCNTAKRNELLIVTKVI